MKIFNLCFLALVLSFFYSNGQQANLTEKYIELTLGKSSDNTFTKSEAAQFIATFPSNDTIANSVLANAYLGVGKVWDREGLIFKFELNYEIQKNTLVDKEQDVQQFGTTLTWQIQDLFNAPQPPGVPPSNNKQARANYFLTAFLKHSYDDVKNKGGAQAGIGLTLNRLRSKKSDDKLYFLNTLEKIPKEETKFAKVIQFSHNHNVGAGYIGDDGLFLANLYFQLNAFPFSKLLKKEFSQEKLLFATFDYNARGIIGGDTVSDIRPLRNWSFGSAYEFDDKSSVQFSYNIIKGADPYKGLEYQDYATLAFKFKFVIDTK